MNECDNKPRHIGKDKKRPKPNGASRRFVGAFPVYGYQEWWKAQESEVDPYAADVVRDIFRKRLDGFSALLYRGRTQPLGRPLSLAYKRNNGLPHAKGGYTDRKDW